MIRFYEVLYNNIHIKQEHYIELEVGEQVDSFDICHRRKFIVVSTSWEESDSLSRILLYSFDLDSLEMDLVSVKDFSEEKQTEIASKKNYNKTNEKK